MSEDHNHDQTSGQSEQPTQRPFPKQTFIRPGIDDRPDWDTALSDEDKAAVQRLTVRQKPRPARSAASQTEVQTAALEAHTPVSLMEDPIPDAESAFLDLRDPMVDSTGYTPTSVEITRMRIGFALVAVFFGIPLAALNAVFLPAILNYWYGPVGGASQLAILLSCGVAMALVGTAIMLPLSDHTRLSFGRRTPWFVGGAIIAFLFTIALLNCNTGDSLTAVWVFVQLGFAGIQLAISASLGERVPDKFRESVSSWYRIGMAAGLLLGVASAALLIHQIRIGIIICACSIVMCAVCMLLIIPREHSSVYMPVKKITNDDLLVTFKVQGANARWTMACVARVLTSAATAVTISYAWFIARYMNGVEQAVELRDTVLLITAMAAVAYVCAALATVVLPTIHDKWESNLRIPAVIACVLAIAGAVVPWIFHNMWGLIVFAAFYGFALTVLNDLSQSLAIAMIPEYHEAGSFLAVLNTMDRVGKLCGIILGGIVIAVMASFKPLFVLSAVLSVLTLVCVIFVRKTA